MVTIPTRGPGRLASVLAIAALCAIPAIPALVAPPLAAAAAAQEFVLPPTNAVPNYYRVGIGQRESLEGGAFVARTNDAGAGWYNPAGLARSEDFALNASGNAYELTSVALAGLGAKRGGTKFSTVGTYFGVVAGSPLIKARWLRLGLSFTRPVAWSPGAIDGALAGAVPGGEEQIALYGESSIGVYVPRLGAGFLVSPSFRAGIGIGFPITNLGATTQLTDRFLRDDGIVEVVTRSYVSSGSTLGFEVTGGVQWDVSPSLSVGGTVTAPSARLSGSTRLTYQSLSDLEEATRDLSFRDAEAEFDYQHPLRATIGIAARLGRFELEGDLRYSGARGPYPLIASPVEAQLVTTPAAGAATVTSQPFADVTEEADATLGVALGGNYALSERFRVHAGFFTDDSPVSDPENSILRAIDLRGLSAGVSFGGRLSGSLGIGTTFGETTERVVGPSLAGLESRTTVEIRTWTLLYSISYEF